MVETESAMQSGKGGVESLPRPGVGVHRASMFRGRGEYSIDDKGRLTLPPAMRKALVGGANLVVLDGKAVIWDEATYRDAVDELNRKVETLDLTSSDVRSFTSNTHELTPDSQGRVVIPSAARVEAGLDREVLVLGAGSRIEILPVGDAALEDSLSVSDAVVAVLDHARF